MLKFYKLLPFLVTPFLIAQSQMPEHQKFYISGIEFDTKTYCADFVKVIEAQEKTIKDLETEVARLRKEMREQLQKKLEAEHQNALEKNKSSLKPATTKSKIIISNKPI